MKLIIKHTDYAVKVMVYMAQDKDKTYSVSELSSSLKIPKAFLRQISQELGREGILISFKGKGGGFKLAIEPDKIFLVDLIRIFQGDLNITNCFLKDKICPDVKSCMLRKKLEEIEEFIDTRLGSVTIKSLLIDGDNSKTKKGGR